MSLARNEKDDTYRILGLSFGHLYRWTKAYKVSSRHCLSLLPLCSIILTIYYVNNHITIILHCNHNIMINRHLTTMERLAATIAIILAVAQFLLVVVNASSSTTTLLPALSRQHLLSSHHTNNNKKVCESKVTQSNATIEEEDVEKKSSSLLAVRAFHEALNNLFIVRSALSIINTPSSTSPQLFKIGHLGRILGMNRYGRRQRI